MFVRFIIKPDGSLTDVKVLRPVHPLLDEEALRVVREMPRWKPVRQDGKLDLSARDKAYHQINADSDLVLEGIKKHGGRLPFTDKADPQVIAKEFSLSKNAFKRAVGRLLKEGKIEITDQNIIFVEKPVKRLKK